MCVDVFILSVLEQVRVSVDMSRPGTAGELLRQSVVPPQGLQHSEAQQGLSLDYPKIKSDLTGGNERVAALLLQALRWVSDEAQTSL